MVEILIMLTKGTVKEVRKMYQKQLKLTRSSNTKEKPSRIIQIRSIALLMKTSHNSSIPCLGLWTLLTQGCLRLVENKNRTKRSISTSLSLKNVVLSELQMLIRMLLHRKLWNVKWLIHTELKSRDLVQPSSRAMTTSIRGLLHSPMMMVG